MNESPTIIVTEQNFERLVGLLATCRRSRETESLAAELDRARVVAAAKIGADVVTMHSRVRFQDEDTRECEEVTLVYPHESDPSEQRISVLAPVGAALLGLAAGQAISWPVPSGARRRLRIVEVTDQPEADRSRR